MAAFFFGSSYGALVVVFGIYAKNLAQKWYRELRGPSGSRFPTGVAIAPPLPDLHGWVGEWVGWFILSGWSREPQQPTPRPPKYLREGAGHTANQRYDTRRRRSDEGSPSGRPPAGTRPYAAAWALCRLPPLPPPRSRPALSDLGDPPKVSQRGRVMGGAGRAPPTRPDIRSPPFGVIPLPDDGGWFKRR